MTEEFSSNATETYHLAKYLQTEVENCFSDNIISIFDH
jgi:hypothetical protein